MTIFLWWFCWTYQQLFKQCLHTEPGISVYKFVYRVQYKSQRRIWSQSQGAYNLFRQTEQFRYQMSRIVHRIFIAEWDFLCLLREWMTALPWWASQKTSGVFFKGCEERIGGCFTHECPNSGTDKYCHEKCMDDLGSLGVSRHNSHWSPELTETGESHSEAGESSGQKGWQPTVKAGEGWEKVKENSEAGSESATGSVEQWREISF